VPTAGTNLPSSLQPTDTSAVLQISYHWLKVNVVLCTAIHHTVQGTAIPVLPTRVYVNSGGTINPLVTITLHGGQWSNLCPIYSRIKNFWYTMNRAMGRYQSLSAWFGEHRNLLCLSRSKPSQHKAHCLITILTMPMKAG